MKFYDTYHFHQTLEITQNFKHKAYYLILLSRLLKPYLNHK